MLRPAQLSCVLLTTLMATSFAAAAGDASETARGSLRLVLEGPGQVDGDESSRIRIVGTGPDTTLSIGPNDGSARDLADAVTITVSDSIGSVRVAAGVERFRLTAGGSIGRLAADGDLRNASITCMGLGELSVAGDVVDALVLVGAEPDALGDLANGRYHAAVIDAVRVGGRVVDSIIAAGGDPGADGLFADGDILPGGVIGSLEVGGVIAGERSAHAEPGIYAAQIDRIRVNGIDGDGKRLAPGMITGRAVIDPQPSDAAALTVGKIKRILRRAIKRARQLDVNATISIVDREGNLLAVVRMADPRFEAAKETVRIKAGGRNGVEAVDNIVTTSVIAATKAGSAAFLSTSKGNAFSTRTAGYIIQKQFPPGIEFQDAGPLFGVQLSSLPTSDVNRLPLGVSADPGGLPLYRMGELVGGIGVEADGFYTVDPTLIGGDATIEEEIALAGQIGLEPDENIRATSIFVDGIRLDFANARPPALASLGTLPSYANQVTSGKLLELIAPRTSPVGPTGRTTMFSRVILNGIPGETPDASRAPGPAMSMDDPGAPGALGLDFYDEVTKTLDVRRGDPNGNRRLSRADVKKILRQAHEMNRRLRAAIRRDTPKRSQVTVSVVDLNGNVLGVLRTPDAPVFGYDVSVQKARTAAFFSRVDAGLEVKRLDSEVDVASIQTLPLQSQQFLIDPSVNNPYARHVNRARGIGVGLDGTVAVADRTGGFLSRPNLPDGIIGAAPGPFSALPPDEFSPFNTGLQTVLILPELAEYLLELGAAPSESAALARFTNAVIGDGSGAVPLDTNAGDAFDLNPGGGLPLKSLANGMQIFAGSVPLYEGGRLVGGVGVSGDGIEQDDFIAFSGAKGFQKFGDVIRADEIFVAGGIRLPYVKFPRARFEGQ